ncbi:MAG: hypothetical protein M1817_006626 [Caeruleum heppii]|nr:MAG: hypothetical protein M1817_006626 [Caeruleum heppii]
MSGHNRWSTIKHDKGKNDALKNKQRSVLSQELMQISRMFGSDPALNPKLANAIALAKKAGFPKASIETAIARGQGKSATGAALESLTIEAILPPSTAIVIECQTDSKLRTLQEICYLLRSHGATQTPTIYMFRKRGRIVMGDNEQGLGIDELLEPAMDAGAEDIESEGDHDDIVLYTDPTSTTSTATAIEKAVDMKVTTADIVWTPNTDTMVKLESDEAIRSLEILVEQIEDHPNVQGIYTNAM